MEHDLVFNTQAACELQTLSEGGRRPLMPNGADLSKASQEYLNNVADLMSARPRQTLGCKTPNQTLEEEFAQFNSRVALAG